MDLLNPEKIVTTCSESAAFMTFSDNRTRSTAYHPCCVSPVATTT
jgi:hypothetical protein